MERFWRMLRLLFSSNTFFKGWMGLLWDCYSTAGEHGYYCRSNTEFQWSTAKYSHLRLFGWRNLSNGTGESVRCHAGIAVLRLGILSLDSVFFWSAFTHRASLFVQRIAFVRARTSRAEAPTISPFVDARHAASHHRSIRTWTPAITRSGTSFGCRVVTENSTYVIRQPSACNSRRRPASRKRMRLMNVIRLAICTCRTILVRQRTTFWLVNFKHLCLNQTQPA